MGQSSHYLVEIEGAGIGLGDSADVCMDGGGPGKAGKSQWVEPVNGFRPSPHASSLLIAGTVPNGSNSKVE